jgi:hypothetical protein
MNAPGRLTAADVTAVTRLIDKIVSAASQPMTLDDVDQCLIAAESRTDLAPMIRALDPERRANVHDVTARARMVRAIILAADPATVALARLSPAPEAPAEAATVALVAMLEQRERTAEEAYDETRDAVYKIENEGDEGTPAHAFAQRERARASARWTEAQEALAAARKIAGQ